MHAAAAGPDLARQGDNGQQTWANGPKSSGPRRRISNPISQFARACICVQNISECESLIRAAYENQFSFASREAPMKKIDFHMRCVHLLPAAKSILAV
uniref:Uncharacterized protein n=1 Tax=Oryza rufipogon TaxID=4529 RepID=A0A679BD32_ORYRU|nr:hypothetical protein [Oryza rufipogon]BBF90192.1 hypothetical protein [Oryza rufipogon]